MKHDTEHPDIRETLICRRQVLRESFCVDAGKNVPTTTALK